MSINLYSPSEISELIAKHAKQKRLAMNLAQQTLATRAGVSYGSLKKFETTGQISLKSLLKIALVLDALNEFEQLFSPPTLPSSLDQLLEKNTRKRGRL